MIEFVLVHGGFHGGWCWRDVADGLRAKGHAVFTPTLTGLGERAHLLRRDIGLGTHVTDIENVILSEELGNVVLVGHSYGGMVVGSVADRLRERMVGVVYLDAFIPINGRSLFDNQIERAKRELRDTAKRDGDGWLVPVVDPSGPILGIDDPVQRAWLKRRLTPHPLKCFTDAAQIDGPLPPDVVQAYVYCSRKPNGSSFQAFSDQTRVDPRWHHFEIDTHHDPMISAPGIVVDILDKVADLNSGQ